MKLYFLVFSLFVLACKGEVKKEKQTQVVVNDIEENLVVYNYDQLEPLLNKEDDKTYVVNFWATWCAPCVKELPYFETINAEYKIKDVEVLLVSLDFPKQYEKRLKPFLKAHKLQSKVVALNDVDSNTWIPKVNEDWTGAIPATIIYNKNKRMFYEQSFTYKELKNELNKFIK